MCLQVVNKRFFFLSLNGSCSAEEWRNRKNEENKCANVVVRIAITTQTTMLTMTKPPITAPVMAYVAVLTPSPGLDVVELEIGCTRKSAISK